MRTEFLLALSLVLFAGCGEKAESGGTGAGQAAQWMLDANPVMRIGAEDGAESLHRVMAGTRLRDGSIAIANAGSHQVRIFTAEGRPVRNLGREGDGPGEFRAPAWIGTRRHAHCVGCARVADLPVWRRRDVSVICPDAGSGRHLSPHGGRLS